MLEKRGTIKRMRDAVDKRRYTLPHNRNKGRNLLTGAYRCRCLEVGK